MKQWIEVVPGGHKARIRYPNGSTRSKTFATIREARAWARNNLDRHASYIVTAFIAGAS